MLMRKNPAATRLGKANGYLLKNLLLPNTRGYLWAGSASAPPKPGPSTEPMLHTSGMILYARGWSSFWGTSSATAVLIKPTLPLLAPERHRARTAQDNDLEKPQKTAELTIAVIPARITGFLPKRSDARPQNKPVHA